MTRAHTMYRTVACVLTGRLRTAVALLWFAGAGLGLYAGIAALLVGQPARAAPFPVVAAAGILFGITALAGRRWALTVSLLLVAAQPVSAIAAGWQLIDGIPAERARNLQALGVNPVAGVTINLGYSLAGTALAGWALTRLLTTCRRGAAVRPERVALPPVVGE